MKKAIITFVALGAFTGSVAAAMNDDPTLFMLKLDKAEYRHGDEGGLFAWDLQGWLGKDLHKFWFKSEGERLDGATEEGDLQLLYSRAVAPFWDLQLGWRHDFRPSPSRDWLALGVKGLAPYLFEVDAFAYVGKGGRMAFDLKVEYEYLFTQRLILSPELEATFYSRKDEAVESGSGLSDLALGLRLRYELRREFAPYVGLHWWSKHGGTADYARRAGESTHDLEWVVGIRAWF